MRHYQELIAEHSWKQYELCLSAYRKTCAEFVDATLLYEEADAKEAQLLELIDTWPSVQHVDIKADSTWGIAA
jgi:hypothetical protein